MRGRQVCVSIVTTGLSEQQDEIIEIAAVRLQDGTEIERFNSFAKPKKEIPLKALKLTGISNDDVAGAPDEVCVAKRLKDFCGDDAVVGHEVGFETRFLAARAAVRLGRHIIDVAEFARIVLPSIDSHDIKTLCRELNIPIENNNRAMADAEAIASIWLKLLERTRALPLAALSTLVGILEPTDHPLKPVFEDAAMQGMTRAFEESGDIRDVFTRFDDVLRARPSHNPRIPPRKLYTDKVCSIFEPGGLMEQSLSLYEYRAEQVRMVRATCEAYNTGSLLMVEAGTGTGKSMAYLVPSILWAVSNSTRVFVSTNTRNLQAQLFFKDIPILRKILPEFKCALIKGRSNYLCVRKFNYLLREIDREMPPEDRPLLLPLVVWAVQTETGDIAENSGFMSRYRSDIWARVTTGPGECLGPRCGFAGHCFLRKARALAHLADVIIANHAVIFSEMGQEGSVLPEYAHIVFDEAHNIEDVATEHLAARARETDVFHVLNRLNRRARDGVGRGLFSSMRYSLSKVTDPTDRDDAEKADAAIGDALNSFKHLVTKSGEFFNTLGILFLKAGDEDRIRYGEKDGKPENWPSIEAASDQFLDALEGLAVKLIRIHNIIDDIQGNMNYKREFVRSLSAQAAELRAIAATVKFLVDADDESYVYWAEAGAKHARFSLCAAPVEIGPVLEKHIYGQKETVIFSSATLTVNRKFDFMSDRLGLRAYEHYEPGRTAYESLGSSFDFSNQALLGVTQFLPEPGDPNGGFVDKFVKMLIPLLKTTKGRALVLFTSYAMLNRAYPLVKEALEGDGILVLAQGIDGERSRLATIFERDVSSVLMGTQSFWEGVDISGETLSCLALAKLPFQVFTDPVVKARCDLLKARGLSPFMDYSIPVAVIRLKQGFGRLIRSKSDRGIVMICDRRVATKRYGSHFLNSLPVEAHIYTGVQRMLDDVSAFLNIPVEK